MWKKMLNFYINSGKIYRLLVRQLSLINISNQPALSGQFGDLTPTMYPFRTEWALSLTQTSLLLN